MYCTILLVVIRGQWDDSQTCLNRAMQVERKVPDEAQVADHATTKKNPNKNATVRPI